MNTFQKAWKHLGVINHHKIKVTKLLFKAGLYKQAILHDLSKYSPTEFFESIRFFVGTRSPIDEAKNIQGYSMAWLHHRGRNPHHYEYWIDCLDDGGRPLIIPFKYAMEMVCDYIAAGQVYEGDKWQWSSAAKYWRAVKRDNAKMHSSIKEFFDWMFDIFASVGYPALNKRKAKAIYDFLVNNTPDCDKIDIAYWKLPPHQHSPRHLIEITKNKSPDF